MVDGWKLTKRRTCSCSSFIPDNTDAKQEKSNHPNLRSWQCITDFDLQSPQKVPCNSQKPPGKKRERSVQHCNALDRQQTQTNPSHLSVNILLLRFWSAYFCLLYLLFCSTYFHLLCCSAYFSLFVCSAYFHLLHPPHPGLCCLLLPLHCSCTVHISPVQRPPDKMGMVGKLFSNIFLPCKMFLQLL